MSQKLVYDILKEFEGQKATIAEIRKIVITRYPSYTLSQYLSLRLRSLVNKGCIVYNHKDRTYTIVDTFD